MGVLPGTARVPGDKGKQQTKTGLQEATTERAEMETQTTNRRGSSVPNALAAVVLGVLTLPSRARAGHGNYGNPCFISPAAPFGHT